MDQKQFYFNGQNTPTTPATLNQSAVAVRLRRKRVGLRHRVHPAFSVKYHPEASAGPHDSQYLFNQFRHMIGQQGKRVVCPEPLPA